MKYEKPIMTISVFGSEHMQTTPEVAATSLPATPTNLENAIIDAKSNIMSSGQVQKALVVIQFNTETQ